MLTAMLCLVIKADLVHNTTIGWREELQMQKCTQLNQMLLLLKPSHLKLRDYFQRWLLLKCWKSVNFLFFTDGSRVSSFWGIWSFSIFRYDLLNHQDSRWWRTMKSTHPTRHQAYVMLITTELKPGRQTGRIYVSPFWKVVIKNWRVPTENYSSSATFYNSSILHLQCVSKVSGREMHYSNNNIQFSGETSSFDSCCSPAWLLWLSWESVHYGS